MRTTIVCGLLGAGKTTYIQRVVKEAREKTVVLVNDFGKAGIDGEIFSAGGIESIELPSGCVCCTLKFDLITTLGKIMQELSPEHLLIEPSGVASPSGVLEALEILKIAPVSVVGIVDATEFLELYESQMYGAFFEDQIVNSDIILVNKVDLADDEKTSRTISVVEDMNPKAIILRTVGAEISGPLPAVSRTGKLTRRETTHLCFDAVSHRLEGGKSLSFYKGLFEDLAKGLFGNVVRAKALVETAEGPYRVDLSYGKIDAVPFERPVTDNRLVVIGDQIKRESIMERMGKIVCPS